MASIVTMPEPAHHDNSLRLASARFIDKPMIPVAYDERATLHAQAGVVCNCRQNAGLDLQELGPVSIRSFI